MQGRGQGRARPPVVPNRRPGLEPDINNAQRMQDGDPEYWIWDEWWPYTPPTPAYPPPVGHPDYYVGYPGLLVPTASYSPHLHSMRSNAISTRPHYGPVRAPVHPGLPPWAVSAGPAGYDNSQVCSIEYCGWQCSLKNMRKSETGRCRDAKHRGHTLQIAKLKKF